MNSLIKVFRRCQPVRAACCAGVALCLANAGCGADSTSKSSAPVTSADARASASSTKTAAPDPRPNVTADTGAPPVACKVLSDEQISEAGGENVDFHTTQYSDADCRWRSEGSDHPGDDAAALDYTAADLSSVIRDKMAEGSYTRLDGTACDLAAIRVDSPEGKREIECQVGKLSIGWSIYASQEDAVRLLSAATGRHARPAQSPRPSVIPAGDEQAIRAVLNEWAQATQPKQICSLLTPEKQGEVGRSGSSGPMKCENVIGEGHAAVYQNIRLTRTGPDSVVATVTSDGAPGKLTLLRVDSKWLISSY